jgi:hypothetical protein
MVGTNNLDALLVDFVEIKDSCLREVFALKAKKCSKLSHFWEQNPVD